MNRKVILSADESVVCPSCSHQFSLDQGIARHTIERYEQEFSEALASEKKELEERLAREAERKANKLFLEQINKLKEDLADVRKAEQDARALVSKAEADAKAKALESFAQEKSALTEELAAKNKQLDTFREQELALRRQKQELEEKQANFQVEFERKLDEQRTRLAMQIGSREAERFALIEAEYKKKIHDAQRANEELHRKLQQGSGQLQGEVLELEIEDVLRSAFPLDLVEPVAKGKRGADVIHRVMTGTGQTCGTLVWESKRAANWSEAWIAKLKDDQQEARADIAVLVTTAMPKDVREPFALYNGVWVARPESMRPLAETLRVLLVEIQKAKASNEGRQEKMALLYDYLSSPHFVQKVRAVVEAFVAMKKELDAEKAATQRIWKKREAQLERVTVNMMGMCGELQAIAQNALPQLDDIARLPSDVDDEELTEA